MVLGNKVLMSHFTICKRTPFLLLMFQSTVVVLLLRMGQLCSLLEIKTFKYRLALKWLPVNVPH